MQKIQKRAKSLSPTSTTTTTATPTRRKLQKRSIKKRLTATRRTYTNLSTLDPTVTPESATRSPKWDASSTTPQEGSETITGLSPLQSLAHPPGSSEGNPEINEVLKHLQQVWIRYPTQIRPLQFPEWCLEKIIPTKPFTVLLEELTKTESGDFHMTKKAITQLFIPLWRGFHKKLDDSNHECVFESFVDPFSPAATHPENGDAKLKYPQILHHHPPKITEIVRHYYNCDTHELNIVGDQLFDSRTVTDAQFEALYESTVLIRYLHHQETLQKYIKSKYMEISEVALFDPSFAEQARENKRLFTLNPALRQQSLDATYDLEALENTPDLKGVYMDITNKNIPIHLRYRHYVHNHPFRRLALFDLKLIQLPPNHLNLLDTVSLPSDPVLHSLHLIAKQLSKTSMLIDAGLTTFPLKEMLTTYGKHVWDLLQLYQNPTEAHKERFYEERGHYHLDSFYKISLDNRMSGGWVGVDDPILPYPLTEIPDTPKSLSQPLPLSDVAHYAKKYASTSYLLPTERLFGSWTEELLGDTTPYVRMLYTAKTVNQDLFGVGMDLDYFNTPVSQPLIQLANGKSFKGSTNLLVNPAKSVHNQMLGLKHFSANFRHLYENSEEFREMVLRNFDEESSSVGKQLEAAYHAIQRQHERWHYHQAFHKLTTPPGVEFTPKPFRPDDDILQRYNDQAFYYQEITQDLELWANAWLLLANAPETSFSLATGVQNELPRTRISDDSENRLVVLKWAPRQSSVFLEKWVNAAQRREQDPVAEQTAWQDFMEANRVLHKYYTPTPDRRRTIAAFFTEFQTSIQEQAQIARNLVLTQGAKIYAPAVDDGSSAYDANGNPLDPEGNPIQLWEDADALPFMFEIPDDDMVPKPTFACHPKAVKGHQRTISRFEFPNKNDVYHFYDQLKQYHKKDIAKTLTDEDNRRIEYLANFYSIKPIGNGLD